MDSDDDKGTCIRSLQLMADGTLADFEEIYTPDAENREAKHEPTAARGRGPAAFHATARWLRGTYEGLRWDVHDVVSDGGLVVLHTTMSGRQAGAFTVYDEHDASVVMVFPATGRMMTVTQTHWYRMADGRIAEHWANRDDRLLAEQLGWNPPTPIYLATMFLARRRARRS